VYIVRDDNSLCAANEEGEIVHTGLGVMSGYLDGKDPQNKLRSNPFHGPQDRSPVAIYTGDMGYMDEAGYLFVTGRRDGMMKVSGNRVYPKEIVGQLLMIPGVLDGQVVGIKDDDGDAQLVAFAVVGDSSVTSPQIRRELASRLPTYMVPRQVVLLSALPRTASGKPDVPRLMELGKESLAAEDRMQPVRR
jgi:acyl-CoA synthetase (AMP-forming)/AMP-acid ligase II